MTSCKHVLFVACWLFTSTVSADQENSNLKAPSAGETKTTEDVELTSKNTSLLAKYLWDEESTEVDATESLARYLWDEEGAEVDSEPRGSNYQWVNDVVENPNQALAYYLWDEEREKDAEDEPSTDLARFLWNQDEGYKQESNLEQDLLGPQSSTPYDMGQSLWQDVDSYQQVASIGETILAEKPVNTATQDYIVVAKDISLLRQQLNTMQVVSIEEFEMINAIGAKLSQRHVEKLTSMNGIVSVMKDEAVETAGLKYSAKGDAELVFKAKRAAWSLHNVGNRAMNFEQLDLNWPAANGKLKRVKIGKKVVFSGDESSPATISIDKGKLKRNKSRKITLVFENKAEQDQQGYEISATFEEGVSLAYGYKRSLPVQGRRRDTFYPTLIDADLLHVQGVTGDGVGVAIIDTGSWARKSILQDTNGENRLLAYYDSVENRTSVDMKDGAGHGSHLTSIIASSKKTLDLNGNVPGSYHGIAPDANLIIVKAFDENGRGTYMNVIRAIAYVVAHKQEYDIKVLNLSFSAKPMSHYWQDPLNLAVMAAWKAGIVVVVSAGNSGPDPMSVGVPANTPYVMTVGAMTDHYTPDQLGDDYLATFSSAGPTMEGFAKPEITAPGGHMMGQMSSRTTLAIDHPEFHDGFSYFLMSGTSQAAAVATGVAALVLQNNPELSPDDVKCRMMASANAATRSDGSLAYSPLQQGAGLVNAWNAVHSEASGCANQGLNLNADLRGQEHFGGPANRDADGNFYFTTLDGYQRDVNASFEDGYVWNQGGLSQLAMVWNVAYTWNDSELVANENFWSQADFNANGYQWDMQQLEADGHIWDIQSLANSTPPPADQDQDSSGFIWGLEWANNKGLFANSNNQGGAGYLWDTGDVSSANFFWDMAITDTDEVLWKAGYAWGSAQSENFGQLLNMGNTSEPGFVWQLEGVEHNSQIQFVDQHLSESGADANTYLWWLNNTENNGFVWFLNEDNSSVPNLADAGSDTYLWWVSQQQNDGAGWNGDANSNTYLWWVSQQQNDGAGWNGDASSNTYLWWVSQQQNDGAGWNGDANSNTYLWWVNNQQNDGAGWNGDTNSNTYLWWVNNQQNDGAGWNGDANSNTYLWWVNNQQNDGAGWNGDANSNTYLWWVNNQQNDGAGWNGDANSNTYLWWVSNPENNTYLWWVNNPENNTYLWWVNNPENNTYLWWVNNPENNTYLWWVGNSQNDGAGWNMADADSNTYLWWVSNPSNNTYLWWVSNSENDGASSNSTNVNEWVVQE